MVHCSVMELPLLLTQPTGPLAEVPSTMLPVPGASELYSTEELLGPQP